jgi:hypothetical protein
MKYKTLFRLMLKAIGVYLFAEGIPQLGAYGIGLIYGLTQARWARLSGTYGLLNLSAPLFSVAFGLYLFFGGRWIVDKAIPANRPYCPECGYDLTAANRNRCPECDTPFRWEDVRPAEPKQEPEEVHNGL